jgi:hypothetical protein
VHVSVFQQRCLFGKTMKYSRVVFGISFQSRKMRTPVDEAPLVGKLIVKTTGKTASLPVNYR